MSLEDGTEGETCQDMSSPSSKDSEKNTEANTHSQTLLSSNEIEKDTEANTLSRDEFQPEGKDLEKAAPPPIVPVPGPTDPSSFPDGGPEAWLVVFGGFCCLFVSFGWISSIGVFQTYYQTTLLASYNPSTVAWILSIESFMMFFLGPIFGIVHDFYGPRLLLLFGSFLHVFGLMMTSISTSYYQILLSQGICSPIGISAIFYAAVSAVPTWFFHRRALAIGIIACGSGLGGVIFPILLQRLLPQIGFRWTLRAAAFLILAVLLLANLELRTRLPPNPHPLVCRAFIKPFREPAFALMVLATFFVFLGLFLPFNFVILQAQATGMPLSLSGYLVTILNGASIFGRILLPYLADRVGRFNVMIITTSFCGTVCLAIWLPIHSNASIMVFAALYGFSSGAVVSLTPACVAQISDIREIGLRNGLLFAFGSIAALCGNPIGGKLLAMDNGSFAYLQILTGAAILVGGVVWLAARWSLVGWKIWEKV